MQHQVAVFSFGWQETLKLQTVNPPKYCQLCLRSVVVVYCCLWL